MVLDGEDDGIGRGDEGTAIDGLHDVPEEGTENEVSLEHGAGVTDGWFTSEGVVMVVIVDVTVVLHLAVVIKKYISSSGK